MDFEPIPAHYDVVFKKIFSKENLSILADFLGSVLDMPPESLGILFEDPHLHRRHKDDKLSILDLRVVLASGEHVSVELQLSYQRGIWKRMEFLNSRLFADQLAPGEPYSQLNRAITIVISWPVLLPEEEGYHFRFSRYDPIAQVMFPESSEIHLLEVQKVSQTDRSPLAVWLLFFAARTIKEFEMVAKLRPMVGEAWGVVRYLSTDEIARRLADAEEKHRRDAVDREQGAHEEGMLKGLRKVALQLLRKKTPHEEIAEITGLSIDEIRHLENAPSSQ